MWPAGPAALQVPDGTDTDPRLCRELLLRQPCGKPADPQSAAEIGTIRHEINQIRKPVRMAELLVDSLSRGDRPARPPDGVLTWRFHSRWTRVARAGGDDRAGFQFPAARRCPMRLRSAAWRRPW